MDSSTGATGTFADHSLPTGFILSLLIGGKVGVAFGIKGIPTGHIIGWGEGANPGQSVPRDPDC